MSTSKTSTSSAALPAPRPLVPDSEVVARPHRRRFSAEYKLSIIDQADSSEGSAGAVGALLRREGLYYSHLSKLEATAQAGRVRRSDGQEAWPQSGCQSCAMNARNRNVVPEMVVDPPESIYRDWFQTAVCG